MPSGTEPYSPDLRPLLVSVKQAQAMLGCCSANLFWKSYAPRLELVGTERKRWITVASIHALVEELRAEAKTAPPSPRRGRRKKIAP